jgi:hypothetical protein
MCEILMDKGSCGDVGALLSIASCSVYGVDVALFLELDIGVALMGVLFCEKLGDWVLVVLRLLLGLGVHGFLCYVWFCFCLGVMFYLLLYYGLVLFYFYIMQII